MVAPMQFKEKDVRKKEVLDLYAKAIELWQKSKKGALNDAEYNELRKTISELHSILSKDPQLCKILEYGSKELKERRLERYTTLLVDKNGKYDGTGLDLLLYESMLKDTEKTLNSNLNYIRTTKDKKGLEEGLKIASMNVSSLEGLYKQIIESYDKIIKMLDERSDIPQEWREKRKKALSNARDKYARQGNQSISVYKLAIAAIENPKIADMWSDILKGIKENDTSTLYKIYQKIEEEVKAHRTSEIDRIGTELHGLWLAGTVLRIYLNTLRA